MKADKFESVLDAVQAAGWRKKLTIVDQIRKLWEKATERERQAIVAEVMGWMLGQDKAVYDAVLAKAEELPDE